MLPKKFHKYQAIGNDFVLIDSDTDIKSIDKNSLAIKLCNRHTGIGADGLIILDNKIMEFYNPDGTVDVCGNGMRCVALHLKRKESYTFTEIKTLAGTIKIENLGSELFKTTHKFLSDVEPIKLSNYKDSFYYINAGTPHLVTFVDDLENISIEKTGPLLENHRQLNTSVTIDFVEISNLDQDKVKIRIWERGVGETLGCGTAGLSVTKVLNYLYKQSKVEVESKGGILEVEVFSENFGSLTGKAHFVFEGQVFY